MSIAISQKKEIKFRPNSPEEEQYRSLKEVLQKKCLLNSTELLTQELYEDWQILIDALGLFAQKNIIDPINKQKTEWHSEYYEKNHFSLFHDLSGTIEVNKKSRNSVLSKLYRQGLGLNCESRYTRFDEIYNFPDLVRTEVIFCYQDGLPYIAEKIEKLFSNKSEFKIKEKSVKGYADGYHALHLIWQFVIPKEEIEKIRVKTMKVDAETKFSFEIQLRTMLSKTLNEVTHKIYDKSRNFPKQTGIQNQISNLESPAVDHLVAYLNHLIQYVDSNLVQMKKDFGVPEK